MFCGSCQTIKAGAGCYLAGAETRVCVDCFVSRSGNSPLPSNAPAALGGAFASAERLNQFRLENDGEPVSKKMNRAGKQIVAGVAGFREWRDDKKREFREAKESFWKEMPEEVQEYRNRAKQEIDAVAGPVQEKMKETTDGVLDRANKLLDELF